MTEATMYPTRTTSTTGTFRVPSAAAATPTAPALRVTGDLYPTPPRPLTPPTAQTAPPAERPPTAEAPVAGAAANVPTYPAAAGPRSEPPAEPLRLVDPLPHAAQAVPAAGPVPYGAQAVPAAGLAAETAATPDAVLPYAAQAAPVAGVAANVPTYPAGPGPRSEPPAEPLRLVDPLSPAAQAVPAAGPVPYAAQAAPVAGVAANVPTYPAGPGPRSEPPAEVLRLVDPLSPAAQAVPAAGLAAETAAAADTLLPHAAQAGRTADVAVNLPPHSAETGAEPCVDVLRLADPFSHAAPSGSGAGLSAVATVSADSAAPDRSGGRAWVAGTPARLLAAPREVALPHGRPASDTARSEVPAARIRAEVEPVPALTGAVDRAGHEADPEPAPAYGHVVLQAASESAHGHGHGEAGPGGPYGHEPDPVVCVPAPAGPGPDEAAHTGVATLRLRCLDGAGEPLPPHGQVWPPAGPEAATGSEPVTGSPAQRYGEAWPPAAPQGDPEPPAHGRTHAHGAAGPQAGAEPAHPPGQAGHEAGPEPAPAYGQVGLQGGPESPHGHGHGHGHGEAGPEGTYGVPGPAVADIVAQAVARGIGAEHEEPDPQGLPRVAPVRGTAVTEVPVHLPFPAESRRAPAQPPAPARPPAAAPRPRALRPAPGRRVPRGDDRLREHRGPVLPGWVGVGVGGLALAGCLAVLWRAGAVPAAFVAAFGATPRAYQGLRATHWPPLAFLGIVALLALGGLGRAKAGHAWVLTLFGRYRGTVRRTGLTWVSPLLLRRRVDVRLRHWRSEPMPAVDSGGLALRVVVQVVWQVKDTARATLAVEDHTDYLAEQVESAMARVLSQLPADAFHEDAPTLRDAEAVGDALTRMLATETEAVGIEVYSAQPTRIEYAPDVAEAMRRRRVAAIDAKHRDTVLTSIVDAVDDTVHRLTSRGLVELDDYERKALVKDLTVAFYTGRPE
ncbi:SPFH domain-containing protein [Streptomyces sp. NPDC057686]|uniref:SPFH domain-containing protein n=1 Tax=Streptomyces sp. NPDC057686 TaxID=3346212 RepID=UPI0036952109